MFSVKRISTALLATGLFSCACVWPAASHAQQPPVATATAEIHLANERWQSLPGDVRMVYIGPGERPWYVTQFDSAATDVAKSKADIETQWSKPAPVLHLERPALFEKSGRVWFVTADGRTLLGYDGKSWIERATHASARSKRAFLGDAPEHGHTTDTPCNVDLGAVQAFVETTGFSAFDGKNWSYQEISQQENGPLALFPERGGKGVLAVQMGPAHVWRFADGKWSAVPLGLDAKTVFQAAAPLADGALMVQTIAGGLTRLPLDGTGSTEIKTKQAMMFEDINVNAQGPWLFGDGSGHMCIAVGNVPASTAPGHAGMYVVRPDGSRVLLWMAHGGRQAPMFCDGGKTLWIGGMGGLQRVDLAATPPKIAPFPDRAFGFVQAVAADGTVFVSTGAPMANGLLAGSSQAGAPPELTRVVVYKPQAADTRLTLAAAGVEADMTSPVLAADGMLWSSLKRGVCRFDGKEWTTVHDHYAMMTELYPGQSGEVLMWQGKVFALLRETSRIDGAMLDDLVKGHPAEFAKAFGATVDVSVFRRTTTRSMVLPALASGVPNAGGWSIATDKEGRIWMTISRTLRVLDKGEWVSVAWPEVIPIPGKQVLIPGPSLVIPVEGGTGMFIYAARDAEPVTGLANINKPWPPITDYVATFKDGKAELKPMVDSAHVTLFEDAEHTLWVIQGSDPKYEVRRVGAAGVLDTFPLSRMPIFLDRLGAVWLTPGNESYELLIDRKVAGQVTVPGADGMSRLCSDKSGSVWVWTATGLHHMVAEPGKPADYKLQASYAVQAEDGTMVAGNGAEFGISRKGFLFAAARAGGPESKRYVYTATLPDR